MKGQEEKLRAWLMRTESKKEELETEVIRKKTCCGTEWSYISTVWSEARCHKCGGVLND